MEVRPDVSASLLAYLAGEPGLYVRQPNIVGPPIAADRDVMAAPIIRAIDHEPANAGGELEPSFAGSITRRRRPVFDQDRPRLEEATPGSRCLVRFPGRSGLPGRDKRLCLTDIADAGSPVLFVFLDMPAAARRGLGRRNRSKIRNGPVADLGPRQDRSTLWLLGVQIQRAVQIECAQPAIITLLRLWNPQSRCSEGLPDWRAAHCGI